MDCIKLWIQYILYVTYIKWYILNELIQYRRYCIDGAIKVLIYLNVYTRVKIYKVAPFEIHFQIQNLWTHAHLWNVCYLSSSLRLTSLQTYTVVLFRIGKIFFYFICIKMSDNEEIHQLRRSGSVRDILQRIQQKNTAWLNWDF